MASSRTYWWVDGDLENWSALPIERRQRVAIRNAPTIELILPCLRSSAPVHDAFAAEVELLVTSLVGLLGYKQPVNLCRFVSRLYERVPLKYDRVRVLIHDTNPMLIGNGDPASCVVQPFDGQKSDRGERHLCVTPWLINERSASAGIPLAVDSERSMQSRWAKDRGFSGALLINTAANIVGTCDGTIVVDNGYELTTPAEQDGALRTFWRQRLVRSTIVSEARVTSLDLMSARSVAAIDTAGRVTEVISVDDNDVSRSRHLASRVERLLNRPTHL